MSEVSPYRFGANRASGRPAHAVSMPSHTALMSAVSFTFRSFNNHPLYLTALLIISLNRLSTSSAKLSFISQKSVNSAKAHRP